jgi:hypothetical protein
MSTQTSSIDDILLNQERAPSMPVSPEEANIHAEEIIDNAPRETLDEVSIPEVNIYEEAPTIESEATPAKELDDYGNEKTPSRTYTEEEVSERINQAIRDRVARFERNSGQQVQNQTQIQQATQQGFEYNAESGESWQQQLEGFVEQTVSRMNQKQAQQAYQQREQQVQAEFEAKFRQSATRFNDYQQVVANQPITDAMVMATRSMQDPAAFIYAASKRAPQELQRIANIQDPLTQAVEMGKLEERMKQTRPGTKAPKPVSRAQEDASIPHKNNKEPSIEELISRDAAKRLAKQGQFRK